MSTPQNSSNHISKTFKSLDTTAVGVHKVILVQIKLDVGSNCQTTNKAAEGRPQSDATSPTSPGYIKSNVFAVVALANSFSAVSITTLHMLTTQRQALDHLFLCHTLLDCFITLGAAKHWCKHVSELRTNFNKQQSHVLLCSWSCDEWQSTFTDLWGIWQHLELTLMETFPPGHEHWDSPPAIAGQTLSW